MVINDEAFTWLMTLSVSERRMIWRKLATHEWILEWSSDEHKFELKPIV